MTFVPPSFRFIPIFGDSSKATLRLVRVDGLSTIGGDAYSDSGVLYVSIVGAVVTAYADMYRTVPVLQGTSAALGTPFALSAVGGSGLSGQAIMEAYTTDDADVVALVSLAIDPDVQLSPAIAATMPGYDPAYGLAFLHAIAQRDILCTHLPARVPHLYPTKVGINQFTPGQRSSIDIPDLRKISGAGQLREAQAAMVKARSYQQNEHLEEAAAVASAASQRFMDIMKAIAEANVLEFEAKITEEADWSGSVSFTQMTRG